MEMGTLNLNTLFFIFSFVIAHLMFTTTSQPNFFFSACSDKGNYTNDNPFKKNFDTVLASIFSNSNADTGPVDYGFYNATAGEDDPDRANAKVLCRKGVPLDDCKTCVNDSVSRITQNCPNQKEAAGWYHNCQFLYTNNSIHGEIDIMSGPQIYYNTGTAPDKNDFNSELGAFLDGLRENAASGTSIRKSGSGTLKLTSPNMFNVFGLVDCFPDMSYFECDNCLRRLQIDIASCCGGSIGSRTLATSCQINYEIHPIYSSLLPLPPPPPAAGFPSSLPPSIGNDHRDKYPISTTVIIIVIVVSILSVSILIIIIFIFLRKRKPKQNIERGLDGILPTTDEISNIETLEFNFETIKLGTNEFSDENKLGEGGFGVVYKCKLPNGQHVAVKRQLAKNSKEGNVELKNEVLWVAKLQHRNLVRLLGFCFQKNERLLIYEFVHNGNLHQILFDSRGQMFLNWGRRYEIISGIARGLLYLHEDSRLRIIHRDLKASNILLDEEFNPKIADFGTARLFEVDETQGNTNKVVGTYGYMAPEYISRGQFSVKSDVFSFGVLVLEILCGKTNTNSNVENLLSYAWRNWKAGTTMNVIDPTLSDGSRIEMIRCIHIGLLCVQEKPGDRPTMTSVILMLSTLSFTLPLPSKPAFFMHSDIVDEPNAFSNSNYKLGMNHSNLETSNNEASISELDPR